MRFDILLLYALNCAAFAADDVVRMKPYPVSGRFVEVDVTCAENSDRIEEARVIWVAPGSAEEKLGLRRGDCLVAINGGRIIGKSVAVLSNFSTGVLTFEGRRGLFRRKVSITFKGEPMKDETPNKSPEPTPTAVTPRAMKIESERKKSNHRSIEARVAPAAVVAHL